MLSWQKCGYHLFVAHGPITLLLSLVACLPTPNQDTQDRRQARQETTNLNRADLPSSARALTKSKLTTLSASELQEQPMPTLKNLARERVQQDQLEGEELRLLEALNAKLCSKLVEKRHLCPASKRLFADAFDLALQCQGDSEPLEGLPTLISVALTGANNSGPFSLLADNLYASSTFPSDLLSAVTFKAPSASTQQAPQFVRLTKLSLISPTKLSTEAAGKKIYLSLSLDGKQVLHSEIKLSELESAQAPSSPGSPWVYSLDISALQQLRAHDSCLYSLKEINEIKAEVRNSSVHEQVLARMQADRGMDLEANEDTASRSSLIKAILSSQSNIASRYQNLESERNRQFKLSNELLSDKNLGCQAYQPINSFALELEGSLESQVYRGKRSSKRSAEADAGTATELLFDFGGVKFTVDFAKENILGQHYIYSKDVSDEAVVASLDRVSITKLGTGYDNVGTPCNKDQGMIGSIGRIFSNKTCYDVYEEGVFAISAVTLFVNGKKAYTKRGISANFDSDKRRWQDSLTDNEQWTKLMLDEACESTQ